MKKPRCLEKRAARVGVKNIYGFEFLVEFVDLSMITGIVAMAFYLQRVVSELEEKDFSVWLTSLWPCLCQQSSIWVFAFGDTCCSSLVASAWGQVKLLLRACA